MNITTAYTNTGITFYDIAIYGTTAIVVGSNGTILVSTDNGTTWERKSSLTEATLSKIRIHKNEVFVMGEDSSNHFVILYSNDTGNTWSIKNNTLPCLQTLRDFDFYENTCILLAGPIYVSHDYGMTWIIASSYLCVSVKMQENIAVAVINLDNSTAYNIYVSTDFGDTWVPKNTGKGSLSKVIFYEKIALAVGSGGIFISSDSCNSWVKKDSNIYYDVARYGTIAIAVGRAGIISVSIDNGLNWTSKTSGTAENIFNIEIYGHEAIALSEKNILLSNDFGNTWTNNSKIVSALFMYGNATIAIYTHSIYIIAGYNCLSGLEDYLTGSQRCGCETKDIGTRFADFMDGSLLSPRQYCNSHGQVKNLALVRPDSPLASKFQVCVGALSPYVIALLGTNSNGILNYVRYSLMSAVSDLEVTTNDYGTCVEFKPSGFKIQWIKFDEAGLTDYATLPLPKAYQNTDFLSVRQLNRRTSASDTWAVSFYVGNVDKQHVEVRREPAATGKGGVVTFGI